MFFRESAAERHGISQTDFLGKPWQELGFPATFMASFTTQLQAAIKAALQDAPYTLIGVQDPLTVMELAQELHPCAITLDVMMPQLNGWQLLHQLKNNPATASIPIIMLISCLLLKWCLDGGSCSSPSLLASLSGWE